MSRSLAEIVRTATHGGARHMMLGALVGKVVNNRDPDELARVQVQFPFDSQGAHSAAWAMPVYPFGGQLATDVPEEGAFVLCLFIDGNPNEPFYIGQTRGRPRKGEIRDLTTDDGEGLHVALAEAVDRGFQDVLRYLKSHTHRVIVTPKGISSAPGAPIGGLPSPAETMPPSQAPPQISGTGAKYVRVAAKNKED